MPRLSVDLIEWDGRRFCVLMEPYVFIFEPTLRRHQTFGLDLSKVLTVDAHEISPADYPPARIRLAEEITLRIWQAWDAREKRSLLRQPAARIHVDPDYETVRQQRTPIEIIKSVRDRQRVQELDRLAKESVRRRKEGDPPR